MSLWTSLDDLCMAAEARGVSVHGIDVMCTSDGFVSLTQQVFASHVARPEKIGLDDDEWVFPIVLVYCHGRLRRALRCVGAVAYAWGLYVTAWLLLWLSDALAEARTESSIFSQCWFSRKVLSLLVVTFGIRVLRQMIQYVFSLSLVVVHVVA